MASSLPIPAPPRTPTPPTPIPEEQQDVFGGNAVPQTLRSTITFDPNTLSPMRDTFSGRFGGMPSSMSSAAGFSSPTHSSDGKIGGPPQAGGSKAPFNFQTQAIKDSPAMANSVWHNNQFTSNPSTLFI